MKQAHVVPVLRRLCATALLATSPHGLAADAVSDQLLVAGAVRNPLTLQVVDLKAFPPAQIAEATLTRRADDKDVTTTVRGVRLTAVLERAALLAADERLDWRHSVVIATATDGYKVAFSWPELFNTEVGAGVLVLFERDGHALDDREGRIALASTRDQRPGPRSVKWLARLDVRIIRD